MNFKTPLDTLQTLLTLLFTFFVIYFPFWVYRSIKKNFKNLDDEEVKKKYGILYSEFRQ